MKSPPWRIQYRACNSPLTAMKTTTVDGFCTARVRGPAGPGFALGAPVGRDAAASTRRTCVRPPTEIDSTAASTGTSIAGTHNAYGRSKFPEVDQSL